MRPPAPHGPALESDHDVPTASFQDPPTMAAARQRIHEIARELPSQYGGLPRFEDETQARPVDGDLIMASRHHRGAAALDVPYESLPSLEIAQPYDDSAGRFDDHEPATQLRAQYDDSFSAAPVARRYVESGEQIRDERFSEPPPAMHHRAPHAGEEDSGARQRPRKGAAPALHFDPPVYEGSYSGAHHDDREESYPHRNENHPALREQAPREENVPAVHPTRREPSYRSSPAGQVEQGWSAAEPEIPAAPAVPHEMMMPAGFVMGVQPLRTAGSVAAPSPTGPEVFPAPQQPYAQSLARTPMMGVPYGQQQAGFTAAASPRAMQASAQQMHLRAAGTGPHFAQPVGQQLQATLDEAPPRSKVGRFAFFVGGAAFGIFFAFLATGYVSQLGKKDEIAFPPAAQLPTQQAPVVAAAPVQPLPQPQVAQLAQPVAQAPVAPVAQPTVIALAPAVPTVAPAAPPVVMAPPPVVTAPPPVVAAPPVMAPPAMAPPVVAAPQQAVAEASPAAPQRAAAPAPAPAPAPRGQRAPAVARRNAPPPSAAPRALPNSGSVDSDDLPSSAPASRSASASSSSKGPDVSGIGDLLSAGLAP